MRLPLPPAGLPFSCAVSARLLPALIGLFALSACGFHLAGTRPLPPQLDKVYIDLVARYRVSDPPLETALRTRLLRQGADVTKDAKGATTVIRLTNLKEGRQVLSVGADGKAQEFLLITTVDYEVRSGGQPLVPPGNMRVTRDYSFNEEQILAKEAEEARLREYIQDELAELLLLRIETQLMHQAPLPTAPARVVPAASDPPG